MRPKYAIHPYDVPPLHMADIVQVPNTGVMGKLNKAVFKPHTPFYHTFLIASDYQFFGDGDYMIIESISKGTAVGVLSFYDPAKFRVLRLAQMDKLEVTKQTEFGQEVVRQACKLGRLEYDYGFFLSVAGGGLKHMIKGSFPPWDVHKFNVHDSPKRVICTELVCRAYEGAGVSLVPSNENDFPAQFQSLLDEGVLEQIYPVTAQNMVKGKYRAIN